jgi:hypothetical protein
MNLSGRTQTRPGRRERNKGKSAHGAAAIIFHAPLQALVRGRTTDIRAIQCLGAMLTTKLENPPLQKCGRNGRHTENEQEYRELLGQGVPGLRNAHPQVDS